MINTNNFFDLKKKLSKQSEDDMRIALIDLECTCDVDVPLMIEGHEIIEIGAVVCDLTVDNLVIVDSLQLYAMPIDNPHLSEFCIQLTGIEQATVDQAKPLVYVLLELHSWIMKNAIDVWGSWGGFDRSQFIMECRLKELANPLSELQHFNIKQLFAGKFGHKIGLERALMMQGLCFEGRAHSGIDDAKNIAILLSSNRILRDAIMQRVKR
ncbi:MAG: exonuclease domain-containing protein [Gammaproteobacteria bacterium]|nr:MAG: exonuclease domain-containing protein [Gammaproteobacteria bacterium]